MIETREFSLLNMTSSQEEQIAWSPQEFPRLWVYHLNYCDFLNLDLSRPEDRLLRRKALAIMADWCEQNATGTETGWEPYPLSLRVVNWLKFLHRNDPHLGTFEDRTSVTKILSSLHHQAFALEQKLEFHLRANHLLKNIKALLFAGEMLVTSDSNRWWTKGANLLESQLKEQILEDGGHCERSPMYHAEVMEDLLDLQTLVSAGRNSLPCAPVLSDSILRMADFLEAMLHPDGEIALFNDSALGVAPPAQELLLRAKTPSCQITGALKVLPRTGYAVIRHDESKSRLLFDCGRLGPDYQPGHGHCDVLSYELSLDGQRVIVDTGVSTYEEGRERHYERSTAAHNTLRIDGEEQAEIWASFRVGRRPGVDPIKSGSVKKYQFVRGSHNGYRRQGIVHTRQVILGPENCWIIFDSLQGKGRHHVESFVHFHPQVQVEAWDGGAASSPSGLQKKLLIRVGSRSYFLLASSEGTMSLREAWYSPEFGRREPQMVCHQDWDGPLPANFLYAIVPAGRKIPNISLQSDQKSIEIDSVHIPLS